MKKALALLLATLLIFSLAACGGGKNAGSASSGNAAEGGSASEAPPPYTVKIYYVNWWTTPSEEGTKQVEDAINDYLKNDKGLNLALDIEFITLFDYQTQIDLILSSGEPCDIVMALDYPTMVDNGYLVNLNPYLDNAMKETKALLGDWLEIGSTNGNVYAIPCHKCLVLSYKYLYHKSYVDAIGYDMSKIHDFFDLEDLFAALKAAYPDMVIDADSSRYYDIFNNIYDTAIVGMVGATVGDDPTIVNYFETEAWNEAVKCAYKYRQLGYTSPEGSANSLTADIMLQNGVSIGTVMAHSNDEETMANGLTQAYGDEIGAKEVLVQDLSSSNSIMWGVSSTSKTPEAAATLLNLMWTDEFVLNTMMYGIEGVDYVFNEDGTINYPEGQTGDTVPYQVSLNSGIFGDEFLMYRFEGTTKESRDYMKKNLETARKVPLFGFTPSTEKVSTQYAAVSTVYNQYCQALSYGDGDPEVYMPEVLSALKAAGIDDILADYQAQVEAWLASKNK
jgi:putative aldouronate transport system substrate-binding protein